MVSKLKYSDSEYFSNIAFMFCLSSRLYIEFSLIPILNILKITYY